MRQLCLLCTLFCGLILGSGPALSLETKARAPETRIGPSGLPVPRFVHLKNDKTHGRVGPSLDLPIRYILTRQHLPLKVIAETVDDNWRKVIDHQGQTMWIHKTQLVSRNKVLIYAEGGIILRKQPSRSADPRARLEHGLLVTLRKCTGGWCEITTGPYRGYVKRSTLWGI